jgi:hypothetical protein
MEFDCSSKFQQDTFIPLKLIQLFYLVRQTDIQTDTRAPIHKEMGEKF